MLHLCATALAPHPVELAAVGLERPATNRAPRNVVELLAGLQHKLNVEALVQRAILTCRMTPPHGPAW